MPLIVAFEGIANPYPVPCKLADEALVATEILAFPAAPIFPGVVQPVPVPVTASFGPAVCPVKDVQDVAVLNDPEPPAQISTPVTIGA